MTQALTNVLLMDAVMGCLRTQRSVIAASKLAYFDKIKHEGLGSPLYCFLIFFFLSIHTNKYYHFAYRLNQNLSRHLFFIELRLIERMIHSD